MRSPVEERGPVLRSHRRSDPTIAIHPSRSIVSLPHTPQDGQATDAITPTGKNHDG